MSRRLDDYLWDGAGPADLQLQALEQCLAPLRHRGRPLPPLPAARPVPRRWPYWLAAAALLLAPLLWWAVTAGDAATLHRGSAPRKFAADAQRRTLQLEGVGSVELMPGAVLALQDFSAERARFALQRGRIEARILPAPAVAPRFFQVATPAADCIDLGCRYQLEVRDDGRTTLLVTEGQVEFRLGDRLVYVPAGAECIADPGRGPSTPWFRDVGPELHKCIDRFDAAAAAPPLQRVEAAKELVGACRDGRDTLPVWHLLLDRDPQIRELAEARLCDVAGEPAGGFGKDTHWEPEEWKAFLRVGAWSQAR